MKHSILLTMLFMLAPHVYSNSNNIEGFKQLIDSTIKYRYISNTDSIPVDKGVFTYDSHGNNTTSTGFYWDTIKQAWVNQSMIKDQYGEFGHLIQHEVFLWNEEKQQWDDGLWYEPHHTANKYNSNGQHSEQITYTDDANKNGTIISKTIWLYDINGKETEELNYVMKSGSSELNLNSKRITTYSNNYLSHERISYYMDDGSNDLRYGHKEEITKDVKGNKLTSVSYHWDKENKTWTGDWPYTHHWVNSYNEKNQLITSIKSRWNNDTHDWGEFHKATFTYNEKGKTILKEEYSWDNGWKLWLSGKTEYEIPTDEKFDTIITQYEKHGQSDYVPYYKKYYKYNDAGNVIDFESRTWNSTAKSWKNYSKNQNIYDENNNLKLNLYYSGTINNSWQPEGKGINIYDQNNNLVFNKYVRITEDNTEQKQWATMNYYSTYFIYPVTGQPQISNAKVNIYPNPTMGIVNIDGLDGPGVKISIFNITGNEIMDLSGNNIYEINMAAYPKGIYFFHINDGKHPITRKVVFR